MVTDKFIEDLLLSFDTTFDMMKENKNYFIPSEYFYFCISNTLQTTIFEERLFEFQFKEFHSKLFF